MTVPALFSCSLVLERGEKRNGAGVALGPAPPSAVLLRARPFLFWAPRALPSGSGPDRRGDAGTDRPRSRAPHALLCRRLCGGCGPCAYYSFSCRSGSFTAPNWLLAPPRALLENAFENGTTRVTGFRRAMGNRISTPYPANSGPIYLISLRHYGLGESHPSTS